MTKNMLKDYRKNKREIPYLEEELHRMRYGEEGLGSSVIMDYRKGYPIPQTIVGFDHETYARKMAVLQKKKDSVSAVEIWIDEIEDVTARMVFREFYVDGKSWTQIAIKIGAGYSEDYVRIMIRDKILKDRNVK